MCNKPIFVSGKTNSESCEPLEELLGVFMVAGLFKWLSCLEGSRTT